MDINDEVYFIDNNKLKHGLIFSSKIITISIWGIHLHNDKGEISERNVSREYKVVTIGNNEIAREGNFIKENELFKTKAELINSLEEKNPLIN